MKEVKTKQSFLKFCGSRKIASDKIKWKVLGDKEIRISINKKDMSENGWGIVAIGIMFALKELGVDTDITIRDNDKGLDIMVER